MDSSGNVYVADSSNNTIRIVTPGGVVSTLAGLAVSPGSTDDTGSAARFRNPSGVAVDSSGNVYVADNFNHTIRKVTPGGVVTTLAGLAGNTGSADGTGSAARFNNPAGVAVDSSGNVYVADGSNHTIRKVTPGGVVTTLAGSGGSSGSADSTGSAARFNNPVGVALDGSGNVYVADQNNSTIRKVTPGGVVTTLAGSAGNTGSADGTGSAARFNNPPGVAVDSGGNVYVADQYNHTIRKVTPGGVVTTLAGSGGSSGRVDGTGNAARFFYPAGVAVDSSGNVYVGDFFNHTIRKVTTTTSNTAPSANAQSVTTNEDAAANITLTGSDPDAETTLTYSIVTTPTNGILTGSGASRIYTPNADFHGTDSFTFKVNDGTDDSAVATVSLTVDPVNDAPSFTLPPQVPVGVNWVEQTSPTLQWTASAASNDGVKLVAAAWPGNI